ncbi:MAG: DNA polymerase I [Planctomycetales bacterium]|nr:DNA polymerase I [Planctomycetales bacterium]
MARKSKASPNQGVLAGFEDPHPPEKSPPSAKPMKTPRTSAPATALPPAAPRELIPVGAEGSLHGYTVYVVDAHSLIYQVFHAMPDMSGPTGEPVGAVHGFARDVLDIIQKRNADFIFCAFDASGPTFRHDIYEEYKENREEMPDDLRSQMAKIHHLLKALGVATLQAPGYEADDILAMLAAEVERLGGDCFLVTSDKDCRQLITNHVKIYNIRKNLVYDEVALEKDWGIRPDQVVDFQSLVGDSVDDVPGVPLIGPKFAKELLNRFETLEGVLDHADEVSGVKRKENLKTYRDQALMSRELVRLTPDVPIEIDWKDGQVGGVNRREALELCREFGFRRLGDRIADMATGAVEEQWDGTYHRVADDAQLQTLADRMASAERIALFMLLTDHRPRWGEIAGIAVSIAEGEGWHIPLTGEEALDATHVWAALRGPLGSQAPIVGESIKEQLVALQDVDVAIGEIVCDLQMADYLLAPGERSHSLHDLARRHLNRTLRSEADLRGSGAAQRPWHEVPADELAGWAAEHADATLRLSRVMLERLDQEQLRSLYDELELPVLEVLAAMEHRGIRIDAELLKQMSDEYEVKLETMRAQIFALVGHEFNLDSPKQLATVLFEELGLPIVKRTKTGPSTDVDVLEELAKQHDMPARIIDYRRLMKLKGTYLDALPALVHPQSGRVHTSFRQDVAATGRLSSQDPNLQNIPIRTEEGRRIRKAFLPEPGWRLIAADYSQIELRVLAHFCGDLALRQAFIDDVDIHTQVASEVYDVPLDQVTSDQRRHAKAINFGVIYGQTAFGLAKSLDIDKREAAEFIEAYFQRYASVDEFVQRTLDQCRLQGYVETILGRRRLVDGIRTAARRAESRNRTLPERIAVNAVIQGSAADLIKLAMVAVQRRLRSAGLRSQLLLQIHDELVLEAPPEEAEEVVSAVREEMVGAAQLAVPLRVDLHMGDNWDDAEELG